MLLVNRFYYCFFYSPQSWFPILLGVIHSIGMLVWWAGNWKWFELDIVSRSLLRQMQLELGSGGSRGNQLRQSQEKSNTSLFCYRVKFICTDNNQNCRWNEGGPCKSSHAGYEYLNIITTNLFISNTSSQLKHHIISIWSQSMKNECVQPPGYFNGPNDPRITS